MKFDAVIFDLDGTLLDTLGDLRNAVNHAMDAFGLPHHSLEDVRMFIGNGAKNLIFRAMPADATESDRAAALKLFQEYYNSHIDVETVVYPGVSAMLSALRKAGIKVCVNSNKYDAAVQMLCANHLNGLYLFASGESPDLPRKPDPAAALQLAEKCGVHPVNTLYVGDSDVDVNTARNGGMQSAWVSWGFRSRTDMGDSLPENCFDTAEELTEFIIG